MSFLKQLSIAFITCTYFGIFSGDATAQLNESLGEPSAISALSQDPLLKSNGLEGEVLMLYAAQAHTTRLKFSGKPTFDELSENEQKQALALLKNFGGYYGISPSKTRLRNKPNYYDWYFECAYDCKYADVDKALECALDDWHFYLGLDLTKSDDEVELAASLVVYAAVRAGETDPIIEVLKVAPVKNKAVPTSSEAWWKFFRALAEAASARGNRWGIEEEGEVLTDLIEEGVDVGHNNYEQFTRSGCSVAREAKRRAPNKRVEAFLDNCETCMRQSPKQKLTVADKIVYHHQYALVLNAREKYADAVQQYLAELALSDAGKTKVNTLYEPPADGSNIEVDDLQELLDITRDLRGLRESMLSTSRVLYGYPEYERIALERSEQFADAAEVLNSGDEERVRAALFRCFGYDEVTTQPHDFVGLYFQGRLVEELGFANEALKLYDAALKTHPHYLSAHEARTRVLTRLANAPLPPLPELKLPEFADPALPEELSPERVAQEQATPEHRVKVATRTATSWLTELHEAIKKPEYQTKEQVEEQLKEQISEVDQEQLTKIELAKLEYEQAKEEQRAAIAEKRAQLEAERAELLKQREAEKTAAQELALDAKRRAQAVYYKYGDIVYTRPEVILVSPTFYEATKQPSVTSK